MHGLLLNYLFCSIYLYMNPFTNTVVFITVDLLEIWECKYSNFVLLSSYFGYSKSFVFPYNFLN